MLAQSTIVKSFTSMFAPRSSQPVQPVVEQPQNDEQYDEQHFLASIAHLSSEEQNKRIQKRAMYRRMAQRQGIMEAEYRTSQSNQIGRGQYGW